MECGWHLWQVGPGPQGPVRDTACHCTAVQTTDTCPPFTRAPRPGFEPGFEPGFDSNRPGYIHTGSGILVVNNVTTGAKYKQITDKLRSSDSRPALLRLIRSATDLYLFLRAFIFCRHYTSVR